MTAVTIAPDGDDSRNLVERASWNADRTVPTDSLLRSDDVSAAPDDCGPFAADEIESHRNILSARRIRARAAYIGRTARHAVRPAE